MDLGMEGEQQDQVAAPGVAGSALPETADATLPQPTQIAQAEVEAPVPVAMEIRRPDALSATLAGLQAGMLGVCWMLAWLGLSAKWQNRSFWTAENLMATAFYGGN